MTDMTEATKIYHQAIWALDSAGARPEQYWLMARWQFVARMMALEGGDAEAIGREVRDLVAASQAALAEHEKDRDRSVLQKQRDYLLGVVARCARAARLRPPQSPPMGWKERFMRLVRRSALASTLTPQEAAYLTEICATLHYYRPTAEEFHADLGIGAYLWQALRSELKMGITLANLTGQETRKVTEVAAAMRNILEAMEHGRHDLLKHYDKSPLQLSEEQYQQKLWEGVVEEMKHLLRNAGRQDNRGFV